jgi:hypothetical protein
MKRATKGNARENVAVISIGTNSRENAKIPKKWVLNQDMIKGSWSD